MDDVSRLVFLLARHKMLVPGSVARFLPFGNELKNLHKGIGELGPVEEFGPLYEEGSKLGDGTSDEAIAITSRLVEGSTQLDTSGRIALYHELIKWGEKHKTGTEMVYAELLLEDTPGRPFEIPKFDTGFVPLDEITGGFYQSLVVIMAAPGTGKTSIMLTMMEELRRNNQAESLWFFENEIPSGMMQGKIAPILKRTEFIPEKDRIFCGPYDSDQIVELVAKDPCPDRVVFFDSPDVVFQSGGERRFDLEKAYRDMVGIKSLAKMIVVASQPRRNDRQLTMTSVAEAWQKAWYADIMIALQRNGLSQLLSRVVKNRFGHNMQSLYFDYDYIDLSWHFSSNGSGESEWGEWD